MSIAQSVTFVPSSNKQTHFVEADLWIGLNSSGEILEQSEMEIELESFRERMPPEAFDKAKRVGIDRLLYDHFNLPKISFE